jgi:hypothetical protein
MESMPVFQTSTSLEELAKRPKKATPGVLGKIKGMKTREPQILTGCWVDKDFQVLAVYWGQGDRPKPLGVSSQDSEEVRTT